MQPDCCLKPTKIANSAMISKSKIYYLLIFVALFYLATFFIQVRLISSQNGASSSSQSRAEIKYSIEDRKRIKSALGLSANKLANMVRVDFETCAQLVDANIELTDLLNVKESYLNELKRIEQKRRQLLRTLNKINNQINASKNELLSLEKKSAFLNAKLTTDSIKLNTLNRELIDKTTRIKSIQTVVSESNNFSISKPISKPSLQSSIDLSKCRYNQRLAVYLFKPTRRNDLLESMLSYIDLTELEKSVSFKKSPNKACINVVILVKPTKTAQRTFYRDLLKFIIENPKSNFLFISPTFIGVNGFSKRADLERYLISVVDDKNEQNLIRKVLSKSLFSSFNSDQIDDLLVHFSMVFDADYLDEKKSADRKLIAFTEPRKYLFSYYQKNSSDDLVTSHISNLERVFNQSESIIIDMNCESKNGPNSPLCYSVKNRYELLSLSKFTLLTDSRPDELAIRLSEALHCATLPVLIGLDLKLPLGDLISWDEVAIRIPIERVNYLIPILESVDQEELSRRQLKACKLYTAYFASPTHQMRTVIAAVGSKLALPPIGVAGVRLDEFTMSTKTRKKAAINREDESDVEKYDGEDDGDGEVEFLGETNQVPVDSLDFKRNFTYSSYLLWNELFYPFNLFPSLPFERNSVLTKPFPIQSAVSNFYLGEYLRERNVSYGGGDGKFFNHHLSGNQAEEQYTIVILTYKREKILSDLLAKYLKYPYLHSIVVVWNNQQIKPSSEFSRRFASYLSTRRLVVLKTDRNSLNNRFLPLEHVKTDAVLSLDDDTSLRPDEVMLAFRVWRENRARLVGFPARYHSLDLASRDYSYRSQMTCEYSMVLTGAAFYHRFYHYAYSMIMEAKIRKKVDELKNCEDIAFNMLVSHMSRQAPLKVTTRYSFYCAECEQTSANNTSNNNGGEESEEMSISMKRGHYEKRSECLRYFVSLYGYNPLLYSQYRADSVLYKTKLAPDLQKCFKSI